MVIAIIGTNLIISLGFLYAAWRIWKIRQVLAGVADALADYERSTYRGLSVSPPAILIAQRGTRSLRGQYRKLEGQIQQIQRVLALLTYLQSVIPMAQRTWQDRTGRRSRPRRGRQRKYLRAQPERAEID